MNKNSCQEFCNTRNSTPNISKRLKVLDKPNGNAYSPGINVQGKYLNTYGFQVGDMVVVEVSANRILIEKIVGK